MPTHDAACGLVPDDRFHVTELIEASFEFLKLWVAWAKYLAGVVVRWGQITNGKTLNIQGCSPPHANL